MTKYQKWSKKVSSKKSEIKKIEKQIKESNRDNIKSLEKELIDLNNELLKIEVEFFDSIDFNYDKQLKINYLKNKPLATARAEYNTFKSIDEYETLLGKHVYDFTRVERDGLLLTKFNNPSLISVQSTVSKVKLYVDYCIENGVVKHMTNIFTTLTKEEMKGFISDQAIEKKIISLEQLEKYVNAIPQIQNKLFIELLFWGVRGRPDKENTLEEIINLKLDDANKEYIKENEIKVVKNTGEYRFVKLPDVVIEHIKECYNSLTYEGNFGKGRTIQTLWFDDYVFRTTRGGVSSKLAPDTLTFRMFRMKELLGNSYLTVGDIYLSGMIHHCMDIYKEKGEVTREEALNICRKYDYGGDEPEKTYLKMFDTFKIYLKIMKDRGIIK